MKTALRWAGSLIGAGGVAFCITVLYESMRAVQKIGGTCASGNQPFQVSHPCPNGVPGLMTGAIFGGLFFLALFAFCVGDRGRPAVMLAWPALFLSLGWNFLYFGINPPGGGTSWGFLVCAVLFILMGGAPLLYLVPTLWKALLGEDDGSSNATSKTVLPEFGMGTSAMTSPPSGWSTTATAPPTVTSIPTVASTATTRPATATSGNIASELERLASLHARGDLNDTEYEEAKRKALDGRSS